jgi:parallel beta-helix repeat protein
MKLESAFLQVFLMILVVSSSTALGVQRVEASGTVYVRADGSIDPTGAPISTVDNVTYTLTGNITSDGDGIVVERDNIVVDGSGFAVEGTGATFSNGIYLDRRSNVTIQNANITTFDYGIGFSYSSNNRISGNNIANNTWHGIFLASSSNNSISGNTITNSSICGIHLIYSSNNGINGNTITNNHNNIGIAFDHSSNNDINGNIITNNFEGIVLAAISDYNRISGNIITDNDDGIRLQDSSENTVYHNNFINNTVQVDNWTPEQANFWDNGREGNYWSNYLLRYPNAAQIDSTNVMDTPYVIDANNQDNYPLVNRYIIPEFSGLSVAALFMTATLVALIVYKKKRVGPM